MILLLNWLPKIIFAIGLYVVYRYWKSPKPFSPEQRITRILVVLAVTVAAIMLLNSATPHYMPKYSVPRSTVPDAEVVDGEVKDLQPKPMPGEERDQRRQKAYEEELPFVNQNK